MAELAPGSTFAGHRIEGVAGSGGMGVVYRARHLELERTVALKVIAAELVADDSFRARFKRESRLAAGVDNPNVVPVYEAGEEGGALFISMRYVDGTDLGRVIKAEGRLAPARAVAIIDQIAYALDAAHAAGLVHRDVKPANVLIEQRPRGEHASLTDFGLSKRADAKSGMTGTGMFVGTIDYIAPEQLEGKPLDARTDVYSLGCVLYHSLTGHVPFERDTQVATMFAHASEPPPAAREEVSDVPVALDEVAQRAMAKEPEERYQSAGEFGREALAAIEGGRRATQPSPGPPAPAADPPPPPSPPPPSPPVSEPAYEPPSSTPEPRRPGSDRRRTIALGAGLAALAAIAIVVVLLAGGGDGGGDEASASGSAEEEIQASIDGARDAALAEDAEAFCGYISTGLEEELRANGDINDVVPTCADLVDANSESVAEAAQSEPTISSVEVDGTTATVTGELGGTGSKRFVDLGTTVTVDFVDEGGTWKLDSLSD